jgi:hypothetical protein
MLPFNIDNLQFALVVRPKIIINKYNIRETGIILFKNGKERIKPLIFLYFFGYVVIAGLCEAILPKRDDRISKIA